MLLNIEPGFLIVEDDVHDIMLRISRRLFSSFCHFVRVMYLLRLEWPSSLHSDAFHDSIYWKTMRWKQFSLCHLVRRAQLKWMIADDFQFFIYSFKNHVELKRTHYAPFRRSDARNVRRVRLISWYFQFVIQHCQLR
jgi:hypothetical protein